MGEFTVLLAIASFLTLLVHLARQPLRHAPALLPLVGLFVGVVTGPYALGWMHPEGWADSANTVLLWASRVTLAIVITALSLSLRLDLMVHQMKTLLWLMIPTLFVRGLIAGLAAYLITNFTLWGAVLLGAALAPVDVVLAGSIAKTPRGPRRLLGLASVEGLFTTAFMLPLLLLPLLMLVPPAGGVWREWLVQAVLRHWLAGVAFGAAVGYLLGLFHRRLRRDTVLNMGWFSVVLALALLSVAVLAQFAEIATVAAGALVFAGMTESSQEARRQNVVGTVQEFAVLPVFLVLGASLPLTQWVHLGWQGLAAALVIVLVGRFPAMLMLRPELPLESLRETVVASWVGAIGVASLYFICRVEDLANIPPLWQLGSLVIVVSALATALGLWLIPVPAEIANLPEPAPEPTGIPSP